MPNVVITGAARGIGAATSQAFRQAGWRVCGLDLQPSEDGWIGDVAEASDLDRFLQHLSSESKVPDVWVNNAGIIGRASILDCSEAELDAILRVNVRGTYLALQRVARLWRAQERGGHVINVSSGHAVVGGLNRAIYAASKAAIEALTRNAAAELSPYGILVNAVAPGFTRTEMSEGSLVGERRARVERRLPIRRVADASEVAQVIVALASGALPYTTGQVIRCDGGWSSSDVDYPQLRDA